MATPYIIILLLHLSNKSTDKARKNNNIPKVNNNVYVIIKEEGSGEMNSNAVNNEERSSGMNYTFDLRSTLRDISRRWYNILIVASFTAVCFFVYVT